MKKLQLKLPLFIVISVVFTLYLVIISTIIGYISYTTGKDSIDKISDRFIGTTISRIQDNVNTFLELPHKINTINIPFVLDNNFNVKNYDILENHFLTQINTFDSISSIYFGNSDGGLALGGRDNKTGQIYTIDTENFTAGTFRKYGISDNGDKGNLLLSVPNFDARTRPWYLSAVKSGTKSWSNIYILFSGQDMAIAASEPVFDNKGNLKGVLSVDLFLSQIHKLLEQADIGKHGTIFIIEKTGYLVASTTDELPIIKGRDGIKNKRLLAKNSNKPYIKDAMNAIDSHFKNLKDIKQEEHLTYLIDGEKVHTYIYPVKDSHGIDWLIAATIPERDFMEDIWNNNKLQLIIIITASIISAIFSLFASAWVVKPIHKLSNSTKDLVNGKWKHNYTNYFIKEIDSLNSTFNSMATQLNDALNELNIEIGERKATEVSLEKSLKEIMEINKKLEDYSYTISHDLKEPIRSIRTFSQFINEDYVDKLDEEGKDYLNRIIKASTKMALMIDDLLLLSRIGKQNIEFMDVKISEIITEVIETLQQTIEEKNVTVTVKDMPVVACQPIWIKTVFQNLINNSIKYSDKTKTLIEISYQKQSEFHEFTIKDNGRGIEKDQFNKIFGLFRKAHQDRNIEGSGAGLAIVTSVMEQHRGKVWIDWSEPGIGTIIKFTIKKKL